MLVFSVMVVKFILLHVKFYLFPIWLVDCEDSVIFNVRCDSKLEPGFFSDKMLVVDHSSNHTSPYIFTLDFGGVLVVLPFTLTVMDSSVIQNFLQYYFYRILRQ